MRKSEFLSRLRAEVCRESEEAMKGTGRTTEGCPYVDKWFGYYADKDSTYIERSLKKYAPEAVAATSASDYIPVVAARVRRSVEVWARTGEITGVPDELAGAVMGGGILGAIGSVVSGIGSAIGAVVSGIGSVISGIGKLFFKAADGGATNPRDSNAVMGRLAGGSSLDGQLRQRMEGAFGHDFSAVRIHNDSEAAAAATRMNARAFTIGQQIAFGPGEYQPGTMIGDALIAHELAHVAQQSSAGTGEVTLQMGEDHGSALEEDADISAAKAVVSMWGGKNAKLANIAQQAMPTLRSGLRLQRCGGPSVPGPNFSKDCTDPERSALSQAYSLAQGWVGKTLERVDGLLAGQADPAALTQLDNHFHITDVAESRGDVLKVRQGFARLQRAFAGPVPFQCEKEQGGGGEGGCLEGGGERVANVPGFLWMRFDIHVYPDFFRDVVVPYYDVMKPEELKVGAPKERAAILIHEMSHKFLRVDDIEYYKGCHRREYNALSTKQALDNADSYAQFARYIQPDK
jgi:hypothetical protein